MRIGYCKLGRALHFNPDKYGMQGDPAAPQLIKRLAERNPEHTFVLASKNDGEEAALGVPNVENPWPADQPKSSWIFDGKGLPLRPNPGVLAYEHDVVEPLIADLDGMILDLGQHGTSHFFVPQSKCTWAEFDRDPEGAGTHPHAWARGYGASIIRGMNEMGDRSDGKTPVVLICEDSRNFMKARDLKWPTGHDDILAQHQWERLQLHERFRDPRSPASLGFEGESERGGELWRVPHRYRHGATEMMILPDDWETWGSKDFEEREPAGIATSSYYSAKKFERRSWWVATYLLRVFPNAEVYGKWDAKSLIDIAEPPRGNTVAQFPGLLGSWRTTMALSPSSRTKDGGLWCCAKPWQCFAARVVPFMVGAGDAQGWIVPSRTKSPGTTQVGDGLWSVREDWTDDELHLARWLRVESVQEYATRARIVSDDKTYWDWLTSIARGLLARRWDEKLLEKTIERKLGLTKEM